MNFVESHKRIRIVFFIFFFCGYNFSCSYKARQNKISNGVILEKIPFEFGNRYLNDNNFRVRHARIDCNDYLAYRQTDGNITFHCINDSHSFSMPIPALVYGNEIFDTYIRDSTLFFLVANRQGFIYDKPLLVSYRFLNKKSFELVKTWDLGKVLDWTYYYVKWQESGTFLVSDSSVFLAYGKREDETNFLDNYSFLKVRLDSLESNIYSKLLSYPVEFRKRMLNNANTYIRRITDSSFLYSFRSMDSIFIVNKYGEKLFAKINGGNYKYRKYERRKHTDLGYLRWYETTNEAVINVFCNSENIIVVKRRKKNEITENSIIDYYFFDHKLNLIFNASCSNNVSESCYPYKDGFVIFNKNYDTLYYYSNK
jgi:hypothetical protein